jgi:hypothetical protein
MSKNLTLEGSPGDPLFWAGNALKYKNIEEEYVLE